ncbi:hypothetical protein H6G81_21445 [Scytonema hofmannii FACHB-248]|uniref:Orn/DAP/Arg decarboxylase 2 N-terminal domain-containing protein n=1 Tax=Scytonema hofmannii FACHB-248 TaxID=1842502 RepID=A0ABR8GVD3_9CYAN|nr:MULTISPECIES: hypothetical protein [Nostocales]MBD2607021.1 hypothetical protein [Scytonema hofmannii FACHB-248]
MPSIPMKPALLAAQPSLLSLEEIRKAADTYGTPLYLYNLNKVDLQFNTLLQYLPSNFTIHYALKANSNLAICNKLAHLDSSVDVSSLGEFQTALKAGFSAQKIVFTGPGKTTEDLSYALEFGCGLIALESLNQAQRLNDLARQRRVKQDVIVRINPIYRTIQSCENQQRCEFKLQQEIQTITQSSSKFGVDEENAPETLIEIMKLSSLNLKGIHIYTESNILAYQDLLASWQNTVKIANSLRDQGFPISLIDFGGGIGIPYDAAAKPFNFKDFSQGLKQLFDNNNYSYHCMVEIGRYLVGESGCYLTKITDIKQSRGRLFLILDGGINHIFRVSKSMKEATKYLEVLSENNKKNSETVSASLVGRLMTSLDTLAEDVQVPSTIQIGDKIAIHNCGAYGFNHSITNFLLHNYPAEAAYYNGKIMLIRERGKADDFFINQRFFHNI